MINRIRIRNETGKWRLPVFLLAKDWDSLLNRITIGKHISEQEYQANVFNSLNYWVGVLADNADRKWMNKKTALTLSNCSSLHFMELNILFVNKVNINIVIYRRP